jgi:hypothetical protein
MIKDILEMAARYNIQEDDRISKDLERLKNAGGSTAMVTFYRYLRSRTKKYEEIIEKEVELRSNKKLESLLKKYGPFIIFFVSLQGIHSK